MQNYLHKGFFHLHFLGLPPVRRSHRTTTCSLTGIVKITETISQRNNDIAPECIVPHLFMIVGLVSHRKILRLVKNIVGLHRKGKLLLVEKLGDFRVPDELVRLRSRVTVIPIVVQMRNELQPPRQSPDTRAVHLIVESGVCRSRSNCVPRL